VVIRIATYAAGLLALSGCVIGRSARPSLNEAAQGPSVAAVTGGPIVPQTAPTDGDAPPIQHAPGATWLSGFWHWDGVRYVWQRGRWQADDAAAANTKLNH